MFRFNIYILFLILLFSAQSSPVLAQKIELLHSGNNISIRGLSAVSDSVIWVSGNRGMVGISTDCGLHFTWKTVKGFEKMDFRDVEAFDDSTALIMGTTEPGCILLTTNAGNSWNIVFIDTSRTLFLDAMEFESRSNGIVVGDPVAGKFYISKTFDGGLNWSTLHSSQMPSSDSGEACFASSGTNIRYINKRDFVFVTGGKKSSLIFSDRKIKLPILQGSESSGANAIAVKKSKHFIIVGGDFYNKDSDSLNCTYTTNHGKTWQRPAKSPSGYRSCIEYLGNNRWLTCGLNGVDITNDNGKHFYKISDTGFHVCRKAKRGNTVFLAGSNGRIGKLIYR